MRYEAKSSFNQNFDHNELYQGIFVGYRGFEIRNVKPLFPFGYGLSYTKFEYSDLETRGISSDGKFAVTFKITNVGEA